MWTAARMERAAGVSSSPDRCTQCAIGVVLLAWDPAAARQAARMLARHLGSVATRARLVLVDNRGSGMDWAREEGFELVSGDNSAREFSGLQQGIEHILAGDVPPCWILANDRYPTQAEDLLPLLDGGTIEAVVAIGALSGRINGYPAPARAFGLTIDSWACSNFLLIEGRSLAQLGGLVSVGTAELASVVSDSVAEGPLLRVAGPLDRAQMTYLTEWLTGQGTALGDHWYRHRPATAESWDDLCGKTQSILNEQLLSAKARRAGIPVVPLASAYALGRFDPTSLSYRVLVALLKASPLRMSRVLAGLVGRNLAAMHRLRPRHRLTCLHVLVPSQEGNASTGSSRQAGRVVHRALDWAEPHK